MEKERVDEEFESRYNFPLSAVRATRSRELEWAGRRRPESILSATGPYQHGEGNDEQTPGLAHRSLARWPMLNLSRHGSPVVTGSERPGTEWHSTTEVILDDWEIVPV